MDEKKQNDYDDVSHEFLPRIGDAVMFLPPDKTEYHHGAIAKEGSPGAGHETVPADENEIDDQRDGCTY